ncbi:hypothetical protein TREMEDRAFT_66724 [Tremella mesenterica DSM 1558]|uniref:uncharacterized protein n=1 Tax=Tremella mesenterica (strain ATCC 24925 / CBS 8224 / DSM 1558 / NBRC 9311 / NRRL Y-6157 / RJB 2259-6 / UBC 559-6) TaxID=578456 RepID=UPI0003F49BF4|nr:uncharacterized protein TREMEDRAFT_66724 [Tremella mesenterica DSM 1558]EIW72135.1 hypothetical protein TREMEDRAFT_66724 [Tremella mesenterica DSM 1558]
MDVDKSLDDMIADKRQSGKGGRRSLPNKREQGTPYARPPPRSTEDKWVHDAFRGPGSGGRGRGGRIVSAGNGIAAVAGTGSGFTGISPRIEVVGLHYEVTPVDLKNIFSQAGTLVQGPTIKYDRSGRSTGVATMEYASAQQAKIAINKFDGAMTKGQTISIRLLPPVTPRLQVTPQSSKPLIARIAGGTASSGSTPTNTAPRGRGGFRGGRARGRGGSAVGARKGVANQGDLDKELDSFMSGGGVSDGAG